jgi:hypothetical protein
VNDHDEFDHRELQALRDAARALPREIAPNSAAWTTIRDRIEQTRVRELLPSVNARTATDANARSAAGAGVESGTNAGPVADATTAASAVDSLQLKPVWWRSARGVALMAAALFLAVTTLVVQREEATNSAPSISIAADTAPAVMSAVFARYDGAATDLQNDLERRRPRLDPAMVAVLDSCLHTLNEAIHETQSALKNAPDNATIAGLLEVTYQQKLDLLRRASELSESF